MRTNRRSLLHAGLLAVALAGAFGGIALYRVARAVSEAGIALDAEASVAVSRSRLHRPAAPAIEYLPAPAAFRDAAVFAGRLYLGGGPGIVAVDELGRITDSWRTGERLPAAVIALAASSSELWIAAAGAGLLRYDGSDFEQILPADAGLRSFTAILPVATGGVLLGTAGRGVLIYDGKRLRAFHPELARGRANALAGSDTDLWVATSDRGLLHLRGGQLQTFSERDGLPDANVLSLAVSGERVWAGTALGVAEFSAARFTRVVGEGLFARALYERASELLVGTLETGAYRIPLASRRPSSWPAPFSGSVEKILRWSGREWALRPDNLYDIRSAEPLLAPDRALLADRNISALSIDGRGRLWVGYFDRGIDVLEAGLGSAHHYEDEHLFCINRIVQDQARSLTAVATANGLVLLDSSAQVRQVLGRAQGLLANHVTDVALTAGGMITATPAGLTWVDGEGPRSLYAFHGLINNHVYSLATADNRIAAGTLGGLSVLEAGFVKANYSMGNSPLRHNWITAVAALGRDFYVGTYGAGVARLDESGRWHTFADLPALEINPNALAVSAGRVYAGSLRNGLWIYSRATDRWTNLVRGLPSNNVTALAAAGGYLFVGSDNGAVRIPESAL